MWYYSGLLKEKQGLSQEATTCFEKAAGQPSHITEITFFAAAALEKLDPYNAKLDFFCKLGIFNY